MPKNYAQSKGRLESGGFCRIPYCVTDCENYQQLSGNAVKLLLDVTRQCRKFNNGRLVASWRFMRDKGWRSPVTLRNSLLELLHYEFLVQTQVGGKNRYSLFGLGWLQIDFADDVSITNRYVKTGHVHNGYKVKKEPFERPKTKRRVKLRVV